MVSAPPIAVMRDKTRLLSGPGLAGSELLLRWLAKVVQASGATKHGEAVEVPGWD